MPRGRQATLPTDGEELARLAGATIFRGAGQFFCLGARGYPMAEKLIQQPSSIAFTTEITEATEKTRKSKCPKSSSVFSVCSVVKALTVKYFENAGSSMRFGARG